MDPREADSTQLITAPVAGVMPDDGAAVVGGVRVARGRRLYPESEHFPGNPAQGWQIEKLEPGEDPVRLWHRLAAEFEHTGLWPIVGVDDRDLLPAWGRYQRFRGEPVERPSDIRGLFRLDRREEWQIQEQDYCFECGVVKDRSGELRIPGDRPDIEALDGMPSSGFEGSVTLVPALRPADAVAELGWSGGVNAGWFGGDAVHVLRSWEERFGAYLLHAGRSRLELAVTRPPQTVEEARLVAREHFHFCRYDTQFHGVGGIGPYVAGLIGNYQWAFWWD